MASTSTLDVAIAAPIGSPLTYAGFAPASSLGGAVGLADRAGSRTSDVAVTTHVAPVSGVVLLDSDAGAFERAASQTRLEFALPVTMATTLPLTLTRFDVFSPDARLVVVRDGVEHELARPNVQLWRGSVEGDAQSFAFLAISPDSADGYVQTKGVTYVVASVPAKVGGVMGGRTVVAEASLIDRSVLAAAQAIPAGRAALPLATCAGGVLPPGFKAPEVNRGETLLPLRASDCRRFQVAIDTDNAFTGLFAGNTTRSSAYLTKLLGAISEVYFREVQTVLKVSYMRVWATDSPSPYTAADTSSQLSQFRTYWIANRPPQPHAIAHLLSGRALGGGIAYLGAACSPSFGFGVNANLAGTFPYPIVDNSSSNWDLNVVTHEMGHNFGTGHTHEIGSYNPIIDGCGLAYVNPPQTQDCTVAFAKQGTIMSYCHICSGGMSNIKMTFGSRVAQVIRTFIDNSASCDDGPSPVGIQSSNSANIALCPGGSATLSVTPSGTDPTLQWYRNFSPIPNATGATLNATVAGQYFCIANNQCTQATSAVTTVTVGPDAPSVQLVSPQSVKLCPGVPATLSVNASGTIDSVLWYRNSAPIDGATGTSLEVSIAGQYVCVATNSCSQTSSTAIDVMELNQPVSVQLQSASSVTLCPGASTSLTVSAAGSEVGLQWYRNNQVIDGATGPTLSVSVAGQYVCIASNACSQQSSAGVTVGQCLADINCSGTRDVQDIFSFLALWFAKDSRSDTNQDLSISVNDIFAFLGLWFAGC